MVYMIGGGDETQNYANQIADALRKAGWIVGVNAGSHTGNPRYDLTVAVNDKRHPHAATVLLDALKEARSPDAQGEANPSLTIDTIQLVVRPKRPSTTRSSSP